MRSLLIIAGVLLVVCAADVFGLGKSDGAKKDVEKPLKKDAAVEVEKPAEEPAKVEPVKVAPAKEPVKVEPVKPVQAKPAKKPAVDKVVVTVNGVAIKSGIVESRLDNAMKMEMARMASSTAANLPAGAMQTLRDRRRKDIIDGLILEQLVDQKMKERKIQVAKEDIDAAVDDIMTKNSITLDQIKEQLGKSGITLEVFRKQLERTIGLEKVLETEMKAAGESSEATEAEAKKFYDDNPKRFSSPEQVRASHILIKADPKDEAAKTAAKTKIADLLKRARGDEDFAELAKQYTEDDGSKATGGEYVFPRGRMVKPFDDAAFSLEVGQISDIVETTFGYHIIKLSEKIPAETTSFEEAKEDIIKNLGTQKKRQFWTTKLRTRFRSEAKLEWSAEEKARMDKAAKAAAIKPSPPGKPSKPAVIQPSRK